MNFHKCFLGDLISFQDRWMLMVSVVVRFEKVRKPMDLVADEKEHFVQVGGVGGYGDNPLSVRKHGKIAFGSHATRIQSMQRLSDAKRPKGVIA
jgi:hypothetical protein